MQKQLLVLMVGLFIGFSIDVSCDDAATSCVSHQNTVNLSAICKTIFDTITLPLVMIPTGCFVAHTVTPYIKADFLTPEAARVVAVLGGIGAGFSAYLLVRKLFVKQCKDYGFSDHDITAMCQESNKQEAKLAREMCVATVVITLTAVLKAIANSPTVALSRAMYKDAKYADGCECKCKDTSCLE